MFSELKKSMIFQFDKELGEKMRGFFGHNIYKYSTDTENITIDMLVKYRRI